METINKAKALLNKDVEIMGYENKYVRPKELDYEWTPCDQNDLWLDIRPWDKQKFLKEYEEERGFFRDTDIPYEGLTDDEKDAW